MRLACAARGRTQALPARRRHSRGPCRRSGTACASGEPPRLQPLPEEAEAEGSTKAEASVLAEARGVAALQFALSREGVALQLKQTDDLDAALRSSRRGSFAAVAGRAPAAAALSRPAAARIVDLLLAMPDDDTAALEETVREAVTPPEEATSDADEALEEGYEAVWTTPLLLLQAIDARLRDVEGAVAPTDGGILQLYGDAGAAARLHALKPVVLAHCEPHVQESYAHAVKQDFF